MSIVRINTLPGARPIMGQLAAEGFFLPFLVTIAPGKVNCFQGGIHP